MSFLGSVDNGQEQEYLEGGVEGGGWKASKEKERGTGGNYVTNSYVAVLSYDLLIRRAKCKTNQPVISDSDEINDNNTR